MPGAKRAGLAVVAFVGGFFLVTFAWGLVAGVVAGAIAGFGLMIVPASTVLPFGPLVGVIGGAWLAREVYYG